MNFYNLVRTIQDTATKHALVQEYNNGDVYEILNSKQHKYPSVILTVQSVQDSTDSISTMNFTLFYVDRLLDNNANKLGIQSTAITVLKEITETLSEVYDLTFLNKSYTPFEEKFADLTAGAYMQGQVEFVTDVQCANEVFEIKTIEITKNGIYDVIGYDRAIVNIEQKPAKWGDIDGDINEQLDLQEEFATKQDKLTPGDNITIENNVISATDTIYDDSEVKGMIDDLSGEIETLTERVAGDEDRISSTEERLDNIEEEIENKQDKLTPGDNITIENNVISAIDTIYDDTNVNGMIRDLYESKQDNLISGENIKTINGESILGSGDIEIQGGSKQRKIIVGNAICASGKRNPSKDTGRIKEDIEIFQHEGHSYFFYEHITFKRIPEDNFNRILDNAVFRIIDMVEPDSSSGVYVGAITINVSDVLGRDSYKSALIDIDEINGLDVERYLTDKNYAQSHTRRASKLNSKTASPNLEIYDGKIICVAKLNPRREGGSITNLRFGEGKKLIYKECRFNNWIKRWKTVQVLKVYDDTHLKGARKDHIFNFKDASKIFEFNNARHNHILTIYRVCKGRKSIYGYKLSVYYSNKDGKVVRFIRPIGTC